ncbi:hypothetical protein LEMLEM_LOCUS11404, partial [Lemmus lemmus]
AESSRVKPRNFKKEFAHSPETPPIASESVDLSETVLPSPSSREKGGGGSGRGGGGGRRRRRRRRRRGEEGEEGEGEEEGGLIQGISI